MRNNTASSLSILLPLSLFLMVGCACVYRELGGPYCQGKQCILSEEASELVEQAFSGFGPTDTLADYHLHFFGTGLPLEYEYLDQLQSLEIERPFTNIQALKKGQKPINRPLTVGVFEAASSSNLETYDDDFARRLVDIVAQYGPALGGKNPVSCFPATEFSLMAMDGRYDAAGKKDEKTISFVSNEFIVQLVGVLNQKLQSRGGYTQNRFVPVGSINPLRKDWKNQVEYLAANGVKWIKWKPSFMGFDPEIQDIRFYQALAKNGIGILTHTGSSTAVSLSELEDSYSSPEKLRKALQCGVRIVMLHMGRMGSSDDEALYFREANKMLNDPSHKGLLFGEFSSFPYGKSVKLLDELILFANSDGKTRLVNGSDYPAVSPYFFVRSSLKKLGREGFLTGKEPDLLDEVYRFNPLLFDFVLKRTISSKGKGFPKQCFLKLSN